MTAAKQAKAAGLRNLQQVADMIGRPRGWLYGCYENYPELFKIVLAGCVAQINKEGALK